VRNLDPARARWIRLRMGILCGAMGLGLGAIVSAAFHVQVEDGPAWREAAERQRQRRLHVEPKRGTIFDRNGVALAVSVEVPSVSVDVAELLRNVESKVDQEATLRDAAVRIGQILSLDANELLAKLETRHRFIWVKRRISADETEKIRDLGDPHVTAAPVHGLTVEGEGHRYYPGRELAGSVLGFVAPDGQGKDGLELAMDEDLRGRVDEVKGLRDRSGRLIFSEGVTDEQALAGQDVTLTIDEAIQHVAEAELDAAQRTYETKGASIVVVDPATGEILALASMPAYNPNDYGESDVDARRLRAITDRFEPGSVMKVFTVAAALAAGTLKPTEPIYCERGNFQIANVPIHDTHVWEWLTPTQVLKHSSNIGALKIGLSLGEPGLYAAFRRFGFGEPTGLPLPGEAAGVLRPRGHPWFEVETATASFGQGISVTAIQLAMAMSAIANGGRLLEPLLVRKITDGRGDLVREGSTHVRREVVPASVARMVTDMLTAVTEEGGTGVEAALPGFRVAGKTGTAQKADPATGKYSPDRYTASFVGIVPADKPRLVIAVVLDEPMVGHYGGDLAGPVFRRVAEASLRYLGVTPAGTVHRIANVKRNDDPADALLAAMKAPTPDVSASAASAGPLAPGSVRVPEVQGMGAHDAVAALGKAGLMPEIVGTGRLARAQPPAGATVAKGSTVRLVFESGP
jgi:cell division protein FtsI (penicillin-binding protein 3)